MNHHAHHRSHIQLTIAIRGIVTLLGIAILALPKVAAQVNIGVGFWNVENLCDTLPSGFYDDSAYTPNGRYLWGSERYGRKITNTAHVIDQMNLDLLALAEVENESVVRDLVDALDTDYCYIHRSTDDWRGMDLALLYKGDKFYPHRTTQIDIGFSRQMLCVDGTIPDLGEVTILVCHLPSKLNSDAKRLHVMQCLRTAVDSLQQTDSQRCLILAGDMNADPDETIFRRTLGTIDRNGDLSRTQLRAPICTSRRNSGSYLNKGRWLLFDNIFIDSRLALAPYMASVKGSVFLRDYLLDQTGDDRTGVTPKQTEILNRTFYGTRYIGGYSDHLPVYVIFSLKRAQSSWQLEDNIVTSQPKN